MLNKFNNNILYIHTTYIFISISTDNNNNNS